MTSEDISINSQYFQVTPEGVVTCQALGVTGENSYINLNNSFIVTSYGNVAIFDSGRWDEETKDSNFVIYDNEDLQINTRISSGYIAFNGSNGSGGMGASSIGLRTIDTNRRLEITPDMCTFVNYSDQVDSMFFGYHDTYGPIIWCGQSVTSTLIFQHYMMCQDYQNISAEETKKNIKKYSKKALPEILETDIYSYNYKDEKNENKKLGIVIGDKYKYSKDIIGTENKSVSLYSMIALSYKAIQEMQEEIEELKNGKASDNKDTRS